MFAKYAINSWLSKNYVMVPYMKPVFASLRVFFPLYRYSRSRVQKWQQAEGLELGERRYEPHGKLFRTEKWVNTNPISLTYFGSASAVSSWWPLVNWGSPESSQGPWSRFDKYWCSDQNHLSSPVIIRERRIGKETSMYFMITIFFLNSIFLWKF